LLSFCITQGGATEQVSVKLVNVFAISIYETKRQSENINAIVINTSALRKIFSQIIWL
jgi:hypothetical protein